MKQKTGPLHVLSLLGPCSWPWSCGRYVDAVCKPLSLLYFVTAVWAEKTDEKWNNQQIKLDTSQTSGNFCYAESWGIIRNVCLDVPFVVFQGCTAEKGCAGHSRGCWWQELLSGMEGIPTQGVASLSLLGICKVGTIEGTEKATREFVFKSGRTN